MKTKREACFIDSSAFIALNHPADANHNQAYEIAQRLGMFRFVISDAVITETYTLLRYRLGFHAAFRFLDTVLHSEEYEIAEISPSTRLDTMRLLERFNDHKISYCDALSVVVMRQLQVEDIFAFDHHFEMMGVKLIQHRFA